MIIEPGTTEELLSGSLGVESGEFAAMVRVEGAAVVFGRRLASKHDSQVGG